MDRRTMLKWGALLTGAPAMTMLPARAAQLGAGLAAPLRWLDDVAPETFSGGAFGVPWPQGLVPAGSGFALRGADGSGPRCNRGRWPIGRTVR